MNNSNKILRSPFFYVGDKYKLIKEIGQYFPKNIDQFIEPFTGGGSVFMNTSAQSYILNDIDTNVFNLHQFLIKNAANTNVFFENIEAIIQQYGLSHSYKKDIVPLSLKQTYAKTFYAKFNKTGFDALKKNYNQSDKSDLFALYILLIYGFNRMLRFNKMGDYNLPCGNVDFNTNVVKALNDYFVTVRNKKIDFYNLDYKLFLQQLTLGSNDFIYFDPPYLITFSEYNKLWNEQKEAEFMELLTELDTKNINFAVSNVIQYKGRTNTIFEKWAANYHTIPIKSNYISYHDNTIKNFTEVLVTNYNPPAIYAQTNVQTALIYDHD